VGDERMVRSVGWRILGVARLLVGALLVTAILSQLGLSLRYWRSIRLHDVGSRVGDFFSAFTHESVLAGGVLLVIGGVLLLLGRQPRWHTVLQLAVLPSILIAGLVYNLLLRQQPVPAGSQLDWANEVMHVVAPIAVLLDWLLAPRPGRLRYRTALVVLVLPIAWLVYTFVRAPFVPDEINRTAYYYPYGFLDPHVAGWSPVVQLVGELLVLAFVLGLLAVLARRIEARTAARRAVRA